MQLTFNEFDNSPGGHQDTREQDNLFLTPEHRGTYEEYLRRDKTNKQDRERKALFFILSGCKDLQSKSVQRIYDFQEHMLQFSPDEELMEKYLQQFSLCSSSRALLLLAVNLYRFQHSKHCYIEWNVRISRHDLSLSLLVSGDDLDWI